MVIIAQVVRVVQIHVLDNALLDVQIHVNQNAEGARNVVHHVVHNAHYVAVHAKDLAMDVRVIVPETVLLVLGVLHVLDV